MKPIRITPETTAVNLALTGFDGLSGLSVKLQRVGKPAMNITYPASAAAGVVTFAADDHTLKVKPGRYHALVLGAKCKACVPLDIVSECPA